METPPLRRIKDEHHKRRDDHAQHQDQGAQLPGDLALAGARVDEAHDGDGVEGREQVEDFEEVVPRVRLAEEVRVARHEDEGVEELGQEGDTWGRGVCQYTVCSTGHVVSRQIDGGGGNEPSELLFRWMENMRMHFAVMCDKSAATRKTCDTCG